MIERCGWVLLMVVASVCGLADVEPAAEDAEPVVRPYDETADAKADIARALVAAKASNKLVLINFGANWCPDCRALERAIEDPKIVKVLDNHFILVKVDIGDWDKNLSLIASWGKATAGGIPTVVVATPHRKILYTTKAGQLSKARNMGPEAFAKFFEYIASFKPLSQ